MIQPLADQLLIRDISELDISLTLARLQDESYDLNTTKFLAEVWAPNRIAAIETFIWQHLKPQFIGKGFALSPEFLRTHVDWASAWRHLRQRHGMGCVQLPKESHQSLVHFVFVAGPNDLCANVPMLHDNQNGDPTANDLLTWAP